MLCGIPIRIWPRHLVAALFPPTCLLCGAPGRGDLDLCPACRDDLPHNRHACPRCALPLPATAPVGTLCGACQRRPPVYDRCLAPLRYQGAAPHLITGLKFHARMACARLLGELLVGGVAEAAVALPECLVPVPLHPARLRERGFNQALEIARIPARRLGLPLDLHTCVRQVATAPQSGLPAKARRRNLRGAFALIRPPEVRHLALVDDVVTTGSTVQELARTLKRAGVARVDVWAVAKTPP
jgi:ComF family protein